MVEPGPPEFILKLQEEESAQLETAKDSQRQLKTAKDS